MNPETPVSEGETLNPRDARIKNLYGKLAALQLRNSMVDEVGHMRTTEPNQTLEDIIAASSLDDNQKALFERLRKHTTLGMGDDEITQLEAILDKLLGEQEKKPVTEGSDSETPESADL